MHFCHLPEIWQAFPDLAAGVLILNWPSGMVTEPPSLDPWYNRARQRLKDVRESELPEIDAWRRTFSKMGLKPTNYRCAAESLLRRFRKDGDLPRFHPLVDLCNAVSLAYAIPIAVFDLDKLDGFLEVSRATGEETYEAFDGQAERPEPDEVVFRDASGNAHSRRWTFRQSRRSVVSGLTTRALIVAEALHGTARQDVSALLRDLNDACLRGWNGAVCQAVVLSAQVPRVDF